MVELILSEQKTKELSYMGRVMAIDYGDQRTGVAVSDLLCILCGELNQPSLCRL